jgi:O-antigen/teichoic acid export membrane protein
MTQCDPAGLGCLSPRYAEARLEVFWVVVGQGAMILGMFVGIKALTNAMEAETYGQLGLGMTIAGFLNQFIYGPLSQAAFRFYSVYREREALHLYFHVFTRMYFFVAVFVMVFSGVSVVAVYSWIGSGWAWLTGVALLLGLSTGVNAFFLALNTAMRARKIAALHEGADAWLRVSCAIAGLHFFSNRGHTALMGYFVGTLLVTASQSLFFSRIV